MMASATRERDTVTEAHCSCGNALVCIPCEYGRVRLPVPRRPGWCLFCQQRISDLNQHFCPAL